MVRILLTLFGPQAHYRLSCVNEAPKVWRLEKLKEATVTAVYDVCEHEGEYICDCASSVLRPQRGACKHVLALREARII